MITIDKVKCNGCGLCVKICHEHCVILVDNLPRINFEVCSTCTQCIAVCPQKALTWDHQAPTAYDKARLPSPSQLEELFQERRSTRFFRIDKIERAQLEEIVKHGIYAPTENFHLRAIIVDDETILMELEQTLMKIILRIYPFLFRSGLIASFARIVGLSHTYLRSKVKVEEGIKRGHAFSSSPAAMIFIIGEKRIPLSDASAQYALANMIYYAQVNGIGTCLCGNGPLIFDKSKKIRNRLKVRGREHILGALFLGYAAVKFTNKVTGKLLPIQWNDNSGK